MQRDRVRCDCGRMATVSPTQSPWEFDERCECGHEAWISYAHYKPPPTFKGAELRLPLLTVEPLD
jgi:hypothetical protein